MAVSQELRCSAILTAFRVPPSKSPRHAKHGSTSSARLVLQDSKVVREFVLADSSANWLRAERYLSQRYPSGDFAIRSNAGPRVVQRREVMQLSFLSGLFLSERLQQNEAVAFDRDIDKRVPSPPAEVGLENGRLRSCEGSAPCVSTSAFRSPSRFMPPWQYLGPQKNAYGELLKALKRMGAEIIKTEEGRYVYATFSTPSLREDIDDLEFLFVDKVVCFRSFSRKTALDPPFCWWPGCINGPRNRGRMEALRDDLGWIPLETDEDKAWTPIFLH